MASTFRNWSDAVGGALNVLPSTGDNIVFNRLANGVGCGWNITNAMNSVQITPDYKAIGLHATATITLVQTLLVNGGFNDFSGGDKYVAYAGRSLWLIPTQGQTATASWTGISEVNAPVLIDAGVTMSMSGGDKTFSSSLSVGGQLNWSSGDLAVSQIIVSTKGVFNVQGDLNLNAAPGAGAAPFLTNYGTFTKTAGNGTFKSASGFGNAGQFTISSGTVSFAGITQQAVNTAVPLAQQISPVTTLQNGTTLKVATYEVSGGLVNGDQATIDGNLKMTGGTVSAVDASIAPSLLTVKQELRLSGNSAIGAVLSGTAASKVIAGTVTFVGTPANPNQAGTLMVHIDIVNPPDAGVYRVLQWTTLNGVFKTVTVDQAKWQTLQGRWNKVTGSNSNLGNKTWDVDVAATIRIPPRPVRGQVFNDTNGNHIRDGTEVGLANVYVNLTDSSGMTYSTLTDANGNYEIDYLDDGTYTVTTSTPSGMSLEGYYQDDGTPIPSGTITLTASPTANLDAAFTALSSGSATTTSLTSSSPTTTVGNPVSLTATVTATSGTPTGTVTFYDGNVSLGSVALSQGMNAATLTVSTFAVGTHSLSAVYNGDTAHAMSTSSVLTETVQKATDMSWLVSSSSSVQVGQPVTFTDTVNGYTPLNPTGTVSFYDNGVLLAVVNLNQMEQALLTLSSLTVGQHTITATYSGDANFTSSTATFTETVYS